MSNKSYCYLLSGACKVFAGIYANDTKYCFTFQDMTKEKALEHIKFKDMVTNLSKDKLSDKDKANLEIAKKIAETEYHNTVMGYNKKDWSR